MKKAGKTGLFRKNKLASSAMAKHKGERAYKQDDSVDFWITMVIVVIAVFAFRLFVFEPIRVDGNSMFPTLHNDERMFVEKISYYFETPDRGDIVICYYPDAYLKARGYTNEDVTFVKRVVALPGETVEIRDGRLYVNGELLDESEYIDGDLKDDRGDKLLDDNGNWNPYIRDNYGPTTVPDGFVFVIGDNRNNSGDSRLGEVGPIPLNRIVGRVRGVIWPFDSLREF